MSGKRVSELWVGLASCRTDQSMASEIDAPGVNHGDVWPNCNALLYELLVGGVWWWHQLAQPKVHQLDQRQL